MVNTDVELEEVQAWAQGLEALHARIASRFGRKEPRKRALAYLKGLLSPIERKNGWQLAEYVGDSTPDGVQRLLASYEWDAELVRDDLRSYVVEHLGDPKAVLVIDETGFIKKGTKSAGVKRQYSGTAGRIENCQIGVFMAYASPVGRAFLDRELYLPREWAEDGERGSEAGVPVEVEFKTKPQLAKAMLERAIDAKVPFSWVTGDEVYGSDRRLRVWLEGQDIPHVLAIKSDEPLWIEGGFAQVEAAILAAQAPVDQWMRLSTGDGAKGPRVYDWIRVPIRPLKEPGKGYWLLVRRGILKPDELAYYVCYGAADTTLEELVRVAGTRWAIEEGFEEAKSEVGLDQYEVRKWVSWYRHITLALLAHAFLAVTRACAAEKGEA
jgi:SRSO17 transposase